MTPAQVSLLRRLIDLDREWRSIYPRPPAIMRGVEVGAFGVQLRTAQALEFYGLAEIVAVEGQRHPSVYLIKEDPAVEINYLRLYLHTD